MVALFSSLLSLLLFYFLILILSSLFSRYQLFSSKNIKVNNELEQEGVRKAAIVSKSFCYASLSLPRFSLSSFSFLFLDLASKRGPDNHRLSHQARNQHQRTRRDLLQRSNQERLLSFSPRLSWFPQIHLYLCQ